MHCPPARASLLLASLLLALPLAAQPPDPSAKPAAPVSRESVAGLYDGGQMEVGAQLLLKPDGHFEYELAYGALDEEAKGTWELRDNAVFLTTVPAAVQPRFVVVSDTPDPSGRLFVKLTKVLVEGMRQRVLLLYGPTPRPDQTADEADVNDDGSIDIPAGKHPTAFIPEIPVYPTMPAAIALSTGGHRFLLRFEPNDIGKADFRATPLVLQDGVLVMPRRDLQILLHFRRQPAGTKMER
jgi:hypothetical protein